MKRLLAFSLNSRSSTGGSYLPIGFWYGLSGKTFNAPDYPSRYIAAVKKIGANYCFGQPFLSLIFIHVGESVVIYQNIFEL